MADLPEHVQAILDTIAAERRRHEQSAGPVRRLIGQATRLAARPGFQLALALFALSWIVINLGAPLVGRAPFDAPPFDALDNLATALALFVTLLILTTQRHENELAERRADLTLQLAILSEQRSAKLIQMIDDLRRDLPGVEHRHDAETLALSETSDPIDILDAMREIEAADDLDVP